MLDIGNTCWRVKVRGNGYVTSKITLEKCMIFGLEIWRDSPRGLKKPVLNKEYLYFGPREDYDVVYYGLYDSMGKRIYEIGTVNTHFSEVFETRKKAVKCILRDLHDKLENLKYCHDLKLKGWRGKKKYNRLKKKIENQINNFQWEWDFFLNRPEME